MLLKEKYVISAIKLIISSSFSQTEKSLQIIFLVHLKHAKEFLVKINL